MLHLTANQWIVARLVYGTLATCAFTGVCSNLLLAFVTCRTKSLRSTCHILIGLCALLDGIHQFGPLIQFPVLFSDGEIDNLLCSTLQVFVAQISYNLFPIIHLLPEMTLFGECACVLSIGIERLTAVLFLTRAKRIGQKTYLMVYFVWICSCSLYPAYLMVRTRVSARHICSVPAPFHGEAGEMWVRGLTMINLTTDVTYCVVAVTLSRKAGVSPAMRQAFRCVFTVMVFDVGGWELCNGLAALTFALDVTAETRFILLYVAGIFVNVGLASKAFIYYTVSVEHLHAFNSFYYRVTGKTMVKKKTTVAESTLHTF